LGYRPTQESFHGNPVSTHEQRALHLECGGESGRARIRLRRAAALFTLMAVTPERAKTI
jgi:hypothetical protein